MLKVMHYNILFGGDERLEQIFKVISDINPDICGILEAVGWYDKKEEIRELAKKHGYGFFEIAKANSRHNIAVISKKELKVSALNENIRHVVLNAEVLEGEFTGTLFSFCHLSPVDEDMRLIEINEIIKNTKDYKNKVVMGDLNSLSPHDPYDREKILKVMQEKNIKKYGEDALRFDVINTFENAGYADAAIIANYPFTTTVPTPFNTDPFHADELRIDYAYVSEGLKDNIRNFAVYKTEGTDQASDHYPVYFELK